MSPTAARLLLDAERDVQTAHDALCLALAKLKATGVVERRLPDEIEDVYLDLHGSAGPLDRILKMGLLSREAKGALQ